MIVSRRTAGAVLLMILALGSPAADPNEVESPGKSPYPAIQSTPSPQPEAYFRAVDALGAERGQLWGRFQQAQEERDRRAILEEARATILEALADQLLPAWLGTPWDFHGMSEVPGEGSIACGYFVTTVLRDAGYRLERNRLAQVPSEVMIRTLVGSEHIMRFSDVPIGAFVETVQQWGAGLYVVGLDFHTGFLLHDGRTVTFIHSSYLAPSQVVRESAVGSSILAGSRYRVVGKVSADDNLLRRWISGDPILRL
jgi:hypothetical protein